jgi:hypothetical protein
MLRVFIIFLCWMLLFLNRSGLRPSALHATQNRLRSVSAQAVEGFRKTPIHNGLRDMTGFAKGLPFVGVRKTLSGFVPSLILALTSGLSLEL